MQITEAILLAGGEGTRLQSAVPHLPKCLAPINRRAFIDYVILHLQAQGIEKFIFAISTKTVQVQAYLNQHWPKLDKEFAIEKKPLGTGGAIKNAASFSAQSNVLIVNGDTLFKFDLPPASSFHEHVTAECTVLLKPLANFNRFGTVEVNEQMHVTGFAEKQPSKKGLINAGAYLLDLQQWQPGNWPNAFSFEEEYLQQQYKMGKIFGQVQDRYFIDIGIREDFEKAQIESINW